MIDKQENQYKVLFVSTSIVQLLPFTNHSADAQGWNYTPNNTCEEIPVDKPCFLTLWGYLTTTNSLALHQVEKYAIFDTNTINMYGNFYKAPFIKDGKAILIANTIIKPLFNKYAKNIFDVAVLPRIVKDGKKLPVDTVKENMNNLTIFTHSYGSYVADFIIKATDKTLKQLEYKPEEIASIFKQLVIVTQSPVKVLCNKPATVINFLSLEDTAAGYKKVLSNVEVDQPTFVVDYNMLLAPSIYTEAERQKVLYERNGVAEHHLWDIKSTELSKQGENTIGMLTSLLNNAVTRKEVTGIFDLFDDNKPIVTDLKTLNINLLRPSIFNLSLCVNIAKYTMRKYFRINKR